jgi:hypothetical protein
MLYNELYFKFTFIILPVDVIKLGRKGVVSLRIGDAER